MEDLTLLNIHPIHDASDLMKMDHYESAPRQERLSTSPILHEAHKLNELGDQQAWTVSNRKYFLF